jgi:hypothetical protein
MPPIQPSETLRTAEENLIQLASAVNVRENPAIMNSINPEDLPPTEGDLPPTENVLEEIPLNYYPNPTGLHIYV